jgi:hypothetical protein
MRKHDKSTDLEMQFPGSFQLDVQLFQDFLVLIHAKIINQPGNCL